MVGNFSGVLTFVESQRKPSELIFVVLNFVSATQFRGAVLNSNQYMLSISQPLLQGDETQEC